MRETTSAGTVTVQRELRPGDIVDAPAAPVSFLAAATGNAVLAGVIDQCGEVSLPSPAYVCVSYLRA